MSRARSARRYHVLKTNHEASRPVHHLFVDVESRLELVSDGTTVHRLWFGWCCYWRRREGEVPDTLRTARFTTPGEFWDWCLQYSRDKAPLHLVSHNVNYDFAVLDLFAQMQVRGWTMSQIYLGGMTAILTFVQGARKVIILDNANFFPGALATLGEALGYPKLEVDPLTAPEAEVDPYCRRDCEILQRAWSAYYEFLDEHDLGGWGRTLPSQAFKAFRHRFMRHTVHIHDDPDALEVERSAYHGGRSSVFRQGTFEGGPYYYLDVNSMYPYVMSRYEIPRRFHTLKRDVSLSELRACLRKYACIGEVTLSVDEPVFPVIQRGHAVYPVGTFRTTLSTPELHYLLEHGVVHQVHALARYDAAPFFREYVAYFHPLKAAYRADGNTTFALMVKLYLNGLYGKFGQRASQLVQIDPQDPCFAQTSVLFSHERRIPQVVYAFGDTCWLQEDRGEAYNSFPAVAAHVTAYARMYLWELIVQAGREHVYYCDTDSLIVDAGGYKNLQAEIDPERLGGLKVEQEADTCTVLAPKVYSLGSLSRHKGVPRKADKTGPSTWEYDEFPSFRAQARWKPGTPFHTTRRSRTMSYKLADGTVGPDGWVFPLRAEALQPENRLDDQDLQRIASLQEQVQVLRESAPVDARTVFLLWDFRSGDWKRGRDKQGNLVPLEYSGWDGRATELGFADLASLQAATLATLSTWEKVHLIEREIVSLRSQSQTETETTPLPF